MGAGASAARYSLQTADDAELLSVLQDISRDAREEDLREAREALLKVLEHREERDAQEETEQPLAHDPKSTATGSSGPFRLDLDLDRVKEKPAHEETAQQPATAGSKGSGVKDPFHLCITLQDKPAILGNTGDITYHGHIEEEAKDCFVSFPGKYAAGWDALVKEKHNCSVACVFLCTVHDGLGKHHRKEPGGPCLCPQIYGERDFKTFGYLKVLPGRCSPDEEERERAKAKATGVVVVRADASEDARKEAEADAYKAWEESGKIAAWGCFWFEVWKNRVAQAVKLGQRLKVVFFPGQVGMGKEQFEDLPHVNLWDGKGCGGSQKSEIAYLDLMKKEEGCKDIWDYDEVDVSDFLENAFNLEQKVDAWDGTQWMPGTLIGVPSTIPAKSEEARWTVQLHATGQRIETHHVRHAALLTDMLADIGRTKFLQVVTDQLPGAEVMHSHEGIFHETGTHFLAIRLRMRNVALLQQVRDLVLSKAVEDMINQEVIKLASGQYQIQVDMSHFCTEFEKDLVTFSDLTDHQKEKLQDVENALQNGGVHLSAPAGAGKTFVAVQTAWNRLNSSAEGQVLFVAPSICLGLFFVRWLMQRGAQGGHLDLSILRRIVLMKPPYDQCFSLHADGPDGNHLQHTRTTSYKMPFLLAIVDESHDIFRSDVDLRVLEETFAASQRLILSSRSQASVVDPSFPLMQEVQLTEVVRSTQRIVAGAAAFQGLAEKEEITSLCPPGPPLKSFLFECGEESAEQLSRYVDCTVASVWHVVRTYAGLSLHNRLALLVPHDAFLIKFRPLIETDLAARFKARQFHLMSFEESLRVLPTEGTTTTQETIVVDTVTNAKGLEQLFIIAIGLDTKVSHPASNLITRALLYQAITRAQLQALVVNHLVRGGWLEFLGLLKFQEAVFEESAALAETSDAAAEIIRPAPEAAGSPTELPSAPAATREPEPPKAEDRAVPGQLEEPKLEVQESSVWDTAGNAISTTIQALRFDPRADASPIEAGETVRSLEALEAAPKGSVGAIHIVDANIGAEGGKAVARAFKVQRNITKVTLWGAETGDEGAEAIAEALKLNKSIVTIDLDNNDFGDPGAEAIADALKVNKSVKEITLSGNAIGDQGAQAIAEALKLNKSIVTIDLDNNDFGDPGAEAIAEALKLNKSIVTIDLDNNDFGDPGAEAIADALKVNKSVKEITLSGNAIGDQGAQAIAEALKLNKSIVTIDLDNNDFGDPGAEA
ncbi:unnamed protein product, partial [Effrenium voratum]